MFFLESEKLGFEAIFGQAKQPSSQAARQSQDRNISFHDLHLKCGPQLKVLEMFCDSPEKDYF